MAPPLVKCRALLSLFEADSVLVASWCRSWSARHTATRPSVPRGAVWGSSTCWMRRLVQSLAPSLVLAKRKEHLPGALRRAVVVPLALSCAILTPCSSFCMSICSISISVDMKGSWRERNSPRSRGGVAAPGIPRTLTSIQYGCIVLLLLCQDHQFNSPCCRSALQSTPSAPPPRTRLPPKLHARTSAGLDPSCCPWLRPHSIYLVQLARAGLYKHPFAIRSLGVQSLRSPEASAWYKHIQPRHRLCDSFYIDIDMESPLPDHRETGMTHGARHLSIFASLKSVFL